MVNLVYTYLTRGIEDSVCAKAYDRNQSLDFGDRTR